MAGFFSSLDYHGKEALIRKHYFPGATAKAIADIISSYLGEPITRHAIIGVYGRSKNRALRLGVTSTLVAYPLPKPTQPRAVTGRKRYEKKSESLLISPPVVAITRPKAKPKPKPKPETEPDVVALVTIDPVDIPRIQPRTDQIISTTYTVLMGITEYDQTAHLIGIEGLKRDSCRWPIKYVNEQLYCGHVQREGKSYCPHHYQRSIATPLERSIANKRAVRTIKTHGYR